VKKLICVFFPVIPAEAGIQYFQALRISWTPVFTGVTTEKQFFTRSSRRGEGNWGSRVETSFPFDMAAYNGL
jgi:hypothetical protein